MRIYIPVAILVVAAALYSWFWFRAAEAVEVGFEVWVANQKTDGRDFTYTSKEISGYPFRLQIQVTDPKFVRQRGDKTVSWSSDALTAYVLPYRLSHIIVTAEGELNSIVTDRVDGTPRTQRITGTAASAQASLVWTGGLFDRVAVDIKEFNGTREIGIEGHTRREGLEAERFQLHSTGADELADLPMDELAQQINLSSFQDQAKGRVRRIAIRAQNIRWRGHGIKGLGEDIPRIEARAVFTGVPEEMVRRHGPVAETTLRAWQETDGLMILEGMRIDWTPVHLEGWGTLALNEDGVPIGKIDFSSQDAERIVDALEDAEVLGPRTAEGVRSGVRFMASMKGPDNKALTVPVSFRRNGAFIIAVRIARTGSVYD